MTHAIARLLESVLRFLLPAPPGRHRLPAEPPAAAHPVAAPVVRIPVLRGEDSPLVRPYVIAHERREEQQRRRQEEQWQELLRQRARRRELWLALLGVDIGPRLIHGVEVSA
ncbi:hypothetical protein QIS99_09880 [Streptomyces sp. B-S-A8]|uniref:Uncharacterized protein n=1 Tax=Streptomyces solicavernae TaxID=3043614 RepID=A0ABT6RQ00_9ACTN|nr:hypothetical protein [Streptomyces sp. B-S-A8]MDI3386519.1 hypothetical protein [Streptomyces sp. B-S-A8]